MVRDRPRFIIIAGPNGAGKTSITGALRAHSWLDGCTYLNPDEIAESRFNGWNDPESVRQAAHYCVTYRDEALARGESVALETVFSSDDKLQALRRAREAGYFVRVFFIGTDSPEINAARITRRVMQGGHSVPIDKIIDRYKRSMTYCEVAMHWADRVYLYDNSGAKPEPQARTRDGMLAKTYVEPLHAWAQRIVDAFKADTMNSSDSDDEDETRLKL
ncbi:MAG: zeta toxin family protein [Ectothiorhodospiraceae bacterium]